MAYPTLAIIPARLGSKGIPGKNFRRFERANLCPTDLAVLCAVGAGIQEIVVSTDHLAYRGSAGPLRVLPRPAALAQDDTPMQAVLDHVLAACPGPDDQQILLLQPTQPLRTVAIVRAALTLLTPGVASVTSVVEVPRMYARPCAIRQQRLTPIRQLDAARRQDAPRYYVRDGSVYAWWRWARLGQPLCCPLILLPEQSCRLDEPEDWAEAEQRLVSRASATEAPNAQSAPARHRPS